MMWTGSLGRRKSSVSSPPPPSRDSPAQPFFASTLAESPVVVGQPTFAEPGTYAYPSATDRERDRDARTQSPGAGPSRGAQAVDGPGGASIPFPRTPTSPTLPSSPEMSPAATTAADQKASRRRSRSRKWSSISVLRGRELERVDEGGLPFFGRGGAGGSAVQGMVVRDYATLSPGPDTQVPEPPAPTEEGHPSGSGAREREFKLMSEPMAEAQARLRPSTIDSAQLGASAPSRLVIDPARLPPARAHDAYLSRIIRPLDARPSAPTQPPSPSTPPDGARPVLVRHSSAPGVAQSGALLPAFETEEAGPSGQSGARGGRQPIFQIYKAELRDGSDRIVRELRGHLEEVLALQREIGRMHLALEGLDLGDGAPGEAGAAKEEADKGAREEKHAGPPGAMKDGTDPTSKGASATGLEEASSGLERREKAMDAIMAKVSPLAALRGRPLLTRPARQAVRGPADL